MASDKKIENYIHLYLGGEVSVNGRIQRLTAYLLTELENGYWTDNIKLLLRPLSDMSEEEQKEICRHTRDAQASKIIYTALGQDIIQPSVFVWLLSKHFDLFGLYEAGLCLYKNDLK